MGSLSSVYFQRIIDQIPHLKSFSSVYGIFLVYLLLRIGMHLMPYLVEYPYRILLEGIYQWAKLLAMKKIASIDYRAYQNLGTGKLTQVIENGATATREITLDFYLRIISEIIPTIVINLLFIRYYDKNIFLVILAGYVFIFAFSYWLLRFLKEKKEKILIHEEDFSRFSIRGFMELVVFRLNKRFKSEIERVENISDQIVKNNAQIRMIHELFFTLFAFIVLFIEVGIIYYQINAIIGGHSTIGTLVALITFTRGVYQPVAIFNVLFVDYKLDTITFKRFLNFLNLPNDANYDKHRKIEITKGEIEVKDIRFSYHDRPVLEKFALTIDGGRSTALAGTTGSGKSTIAKLVLSLLKPEAGMIIVDGQDISQVNLESYYSHLSYVSQDAPIFDGTLRENIILDKKVADEAIYEILEKVKLSQFIKNLPDGLNTEIGERGIKLSGGEKQRLAFARIFLQNPKIIVLDEPTSAMDSTTEEFITNHMIELFKNKTLLIVAHRLQTIKNVDRIIVLEEGNIIQDGTFDALVKKEGKFKELWDKQTQEASEPEA